MCGYGIADRILHPTRVGLVADPEPLLSCHLTWNVLTVSPRDLQASTKTYEAFFENTAWIVQPCFTKARNCPHTACEKGTTFILLFYFILSDKRIRSP